MNSIEELRQQGGYIGVREAALLLGVSRYTLIGWAKEGKLPAFKIGNSLRLDRRELAAWIEDRRAAL